MTEGIAAEQAREALANLPEGTSHGEPSPPEHVYLPPSHLKAMHPDNLLVTGMRGAGKTFWWRALQDEAVRHMVSQQGRSIPPEREHRGADWLWRHPCAAGVPEQGCAA